MLSGLFRMCTIRIREEIMRRAFLTSVGIVLLGAVPALAQIQPSTHTPSSHQNMGAQGQTGASGNPTPIQQRLEQDLEQAGFRDVRIMPESFLVRAKNRQGLPVMMIINPDSVTAVTAATPGAGGSGGNAGGATMPPTAGGSAGSSNPGTKSE